MKRQHEGSQDEHCKQSRTSHEQRTVSQTNRHISYLENLEMAAHVQTQSLQTHPYLYDRRYPFFRKPAEIGSFSIDINRTFYNDNRQLSYYYPPKDRHRLGFDLGHGYDTFIRKLEDHRDRLDLVLKWVQANRQKFRLNKGATEPNDCKKESNLHTDFITWRGHLTKLLCTPYENRDGWMMAVSLFNGTYYMSEVETEEAREQRLNMPDRQKEMTYWGHKFEQYVTSVDGQQEPDTEGAVNNCDGYCSVVRTRLNTHSLVFSGEVDCCQSPKHKSQSHYIELKTSREMDSERQYRNFKRFKLIKWWAQSFLVGVPTIICGFRDDDGKVVRLESFETLRVPDLQKGERYAWNPSVCLNFCDEFLTFVKKVVKRDDPQVVYLFEWNPTAKQVTFTVHEEPEHHFLRDWYMDNMTANNPSTTSIVT
ncbi:decapping and exoribonuclease protein-like [Glandiceps talaboti]